MWNIQNQFQNKNIVRAAFQIQYRVVLGGCPGDLVTIDEEVCETSRSFIESDYSSISQLGQTQDLGTLPFKRVVSIDQKLVLHCTDLKHRAHTNQLFGYLIVSPNWGPTPSPSERASVIFHQHQPPKNVRTPCKEAELQHKAQWHGIHEKRSPQGAPSSGRA